MPEKSASYLLLEVKRAPDDCDGIGLQVTAKLTFVAVHGDELLELCWRSERLVEFRTHALTSSAVHDTVVGTEDELHQLRDRPRNDTLRWT